MTVARTLLVLGLVLGVVPVASGAAETCVKASDPIESRNDLGAVARPNTTPAPNRLLNFAQISDAHILDDDGAVVLGGAPLDPTISRLQTAQRLQDEYTDEVLNSMVGTINACNTEASPVDFMISTGDNTDIGMVNEVRRFIDTIDGKANQPTAYEPKCMASLPAGTSAALANAFCRVPTGAVVADTQTVDPNPNNITYQLTALRTVRQLLDTLGAVLTGRNAAGQTNVNRQTLNRAPGLPKTLQCTPGVAGCPLNRVEVPWYVAFGNHDGTLRGTVPFQPGFQVIAQTNGRHLMQLQHEFIDEFFETSTPPDGHGFGEADAGRRNDNDERNDGYYAFDWPPANPRFRMIVLNTLIDGVEGGVDLGTLPVYGPVQIRNPFALESGAIDADQFTWLKGELADAEADDKLVMVFSHHPDVSWAELGQFGFAVPAHTTAAQLDGELASHPNVIAWVAGHTHRNRIRAFKVTGSTGTNGTISAPVACTVPNACKGFWQIETASLIDTPQEARLIEVVDNGNGIGSIRGTLIEHAFPKSRTLAASDDRCQFYVDDTAAVQRLITEGDITAICTAGGTSEGEEVDRNVELIFQMPPA